MGNTSRKMGIIAVVFGFLLSGCLCVSLPGLQGIQTDEEFSRTFGIIPSESLSKPKQQNVKEVPTNQSVLSKGRLSGPASLDPNRLPNIETLSRMTALQLLQALGIRLPMVDRNQNKNKQSQEQPNTQVVSHIVKPTVNPNQNVLHKIQTNKDTSVSSVNSAHPQTNIGNQIKQGLGTQQNVDQYNAQQQTNPLYMMSTGINGQSFSSIPSQTGGSQDHGSNLFNPDKLMKDLMSSSRASLASGAYVARQNTPPGATGWSAQQSGPQTNIMFPNSEQMGTNFNPNEFNNIKMNFKPNELMMSVGKETAHLNQLSYDPDKVNNYGGRFRPGELFVNGITLPPPARPLFNADVLNKNLMGKKAKSSGPATMNDPRSDSRNDASIENKLFSLPNFKPGLLYPGYSTESEKAQINSNGNSRSEHSKPKRQPFFERYEAEVLEGDSTLENETNTESTDNLYNATSLPTSLYNTTSSPTSLTEKTTKSKEGTPNTIHGAETASNFMKGFVPGSLTGDGRTFQMMINNGMYDPNKINKQTFPQETSQIPSYEKQNTSQHEVTQGFGMAYSSFFPSSVNQSKMDSNGGQQMSMTSFLGSPPGMTYDANRVNQNSYVNPFQKAQMNMNNMSTGMFDNSQFLGDFDANKVNFDNAGNQTNNGMFTQSGGVFNPSEVNKAYFNPNEINKERMNFNPSEMLEKNPGYDKKVAGSYNFDPNKVNDMHMNFAPPFLKARNSTTKDKSSRTEFIPGLLTDGNSDNAIFDPSHLKSAILFNPVAMLQHSSTNSNNSTDSKGNDESGLFYPPSSMPQGIKEIMSTMNKYDPSTVNKAKINFDPNTMMNKMLDETDEEVEESLHRLGHGNHDSVK